MHHPLPAITTPSRSSPATSPSPTPGRAGLPSSAVGELLCASLRWHRAATLRWKISSWTTAWPSGVAPSTTAARQVSATPFCKTIRLLAKPARPAQSERRARVVAVRAWAARSSTTPGHRSSSRTRLCARTVLSAARAATARRTMAPLPPSAKRAAARTGAAVGQSPPMASPAGSEAAAAAAAATGLRPAPAARVALVVGAAAAAASHLAAAPQAFRFVMVFVAVANSAAAPARRARAAPAAQPAAAQG